MQQQAFSLFQSVVSKAKALAYNISETEMKVLEATNEEPWGPHGSVMAEIARMAANPDKYDLIMGILDQRLNERDENWRLCYKALLLLEYLCKQGPYRVADELARSIATFERLADNFTYKDVSGRDQGVNVRQRAGELVSLLSSPGKLQQERERKATHRRSCLQVKNTETAPQESPREVLASKNAGKYTGLSSESGRSGGSDSTHSGGFGSGGFGSHDVRRTEVTRSNEPYSGSSRGQDNASQGMSSYGQTSGTSNGGGGAYANGSSRSSGGGSAGMSGSSGAKDEDPFEATRRRIEKVKQESAQPEPVSSAAFRAQAAAAAAADAATAAAAPTMPFAEISKVTKKMKDVKVNPAFAATFASLTTMPSRTISGPGTGTNSFNLLDMMDDHSASSNQQPAPQHSASVPDLFGPLSTTTASTPPPTLSSLGLDSLSFQDSHSTAAAAPAADIWGSFHTTASNVVLQATSQTASSSGGTRLAFGGPPPPAKSAHSFPAAPSLPSALSLDDFADPFGSMVAAPAPSQTTWGAPSQSHTNTTGQANMVDPFASLASSTPSTTQQPVSSSFPAFTGASSAATGTTPAFDPFAYSSISSTSSATATKLVPLGSAPSRSKDPFADILGGL